MSWMLLVTCLLRAKALKLLAGVRHASGLGMRPPTDSRRPAQCMTNEATPGPSPFRPCSGWNLPRAEWRVLDSRQHLLGTERLDEVAVAACRQGFLLVFG